MGVEEREGEGVGARMLLMVKGANTHTHTLTWTLDQDIRKSIIHQMLGGIFGLKYM